jgi:hypothetical protein
LINAVLGIVVAHCMAEVAMHCFFAHYEKMGWLEVENYES